MDPNPILDTDFLRTVGGAENTKALCKACGIEFLLESLDCSPFFHGDGSNCSDAKLLNGIRRQPVKALNGVESKFPFYMVPGEGVLLFGNEIHHKSILHGPENLIVIPPGVGGIFNEELALQASHVPIRGLDKNAVRIILSVIPAQLSSFKAFFTSYRAFHTSPLTSSSTNVIDHSDGKVAKSSRCEASRLHTPPDR